MKTEIEIQGKKKLEEKRHPVSFIAEAGVNHNGSVEMGRQLIDVAVEAGADAMSSFKPSKLKS